MPENSTFWLVGIPTQIIKKLQKLEHLKIPGLPKNLPEVAGLMLSSAEKLSRSAAISAYAPEEITIRRED